MGGFALIAPEAEAMAPRVEGVFRAAGLPRVVHARVGSALLLGFGRRRDTGTRADAACLPAGAAPRRAAGPWTFGTEVGTAGAFCRIGAAGAGAIVEGDPLGLFPLFADEGGRILSSSQTAVLAALPAPPRLRREALLERLLTGMVVAPHTLFESVRLLDRKAGAGHETRHWCVRVPAALAAPAVRATVAEVPGLLLEALRPQVLALARQAGGRPIALGLSGGYDSRLLLALMRGEARLDLHTYSSAAHAKEQDIARRLAIRCGQELRELPVRPWDVLDDEALERNAEDAIRLWDGRGNDTMGTFSDVHTGWLRARAIGDSALALNGLGGELFRNRENLPAGAFSLQDWLTTFALGAPERRLLASAKEGRDVLRAIAERWARLAETTPATRLDAVALRRLHAGIWLPYGAGPKLAAENQLAPTVLPFAAPPVVETALAVAEGIGLGGACEARMIAQAAPDLAAIESSYGFSFDRRSPWQTLGDGVRSARPAWLRRAVERARFRGDGRLAAEVERRASLRQVYDLVARLVEPWDLRPLLRSRVSRDRVLAVGWYLRMHEKSWGWP